MNSSSIKTESFFTLTASAQSDLNVEKTANNRGFMFLSPLDSFQYWTSSLPKSELPLLDLGSAYGVNTLSAIRAGRDVIAADMDSNHLKILRERAEALKNKSHEKTLGRLIDTKVMQLPCSNGMKEKSVSGILLSEVLHFLSPGEPEKIMKDAYKWLDVGGFFVVNCLSWTAFNHPLGKNIFELDGGHNPQEVVEMMTGADEKALTITKKEMERIPAIYLTRKGPTPPEFHNKLPYDGNLLLHSIANLSVMAREAGFEVVKACYISPRRYPNYPKELSDETALLVARKPSTK